MGVNIADDISNLCPYGSVLKKFKMLPFSKLALTPCNVNFLKSIFDFLFFCQKKKISLNVNFGVDPLHFLEQVYILNFYFLGRFPYNTTHGWIKKEINIHQPYPDEGVWNQSPPPPPPPFFFFFFF